MKASCVLPYLAIMAMGCYRSSACRVGDCKNGGFCYTLGSTSFCVCQEPYSAFNCDAITNYCARTDHTGAPVISCQNGGTCTGTILTPPYYTCRCVPGYTGSSCEINIDECASKPCVNGQCTDLINDYRCSCYTGWEGRICSVDTNYCQPMPCLNGGKCTDSNSTFTCDCSAIDYNGVTCNTKINDCSPNPCLNGGICTDGLRSYSCNCDSIDFIGTNCGVKVVDCASKPCVNGQCTDLVKDYRCSCYTGWEGRNCSVDTNYCQPMPCLNGGKCTDSNSTFSCDCSAIDYSGVTCSSKINDCQPNPCMNGGICTDGLRSYSCNCTGTGFYGTNCSLSVNYCSPNPCINGATCVDLVSNYTCSCYAAYIGRNCSTDILDCTANRCENGGTCYERSNPSLYNNPLLPSPFNGSFSYLQAAGFQCVCQTGYFGSTCSNNPNDCLIPGTNRSICVHASSCTDGLNTYTCNCYSGWEGRNCSVSRDNCIPGACTNGGKCVNGNGIFTCDCSAIDYQGPNCGSKIDDCQPNPCLNGGTCSDDMRSYNCNCLPGYLGRNCSVDFPDCSPNPCQPNGVCFERSNLALYSLVTMPWPFNGPFNASQAVGYICLYPPYSGSPVSNEMSSATVASIAAVITSLLLLSIFMILLSQIGKGKVSLGIFEKRPSRLSRSQKGSLPSSPVPDTGSPYLIPDRNVATEGNEAMYDTAGTFTIQKNDLQQHQNQYTTANDATDLDSLYTKGDTLANSAIGFTSPINLTHINPNVPQTTRTVNASANCENCVDDVYDEAGQNLA